MGAPDGTISASDRSKLYALTPEGDLLWVAAGTGGRRPISAGADGTICTAGNLITAFNPDRTLKWQFPDPYSRPQPRGGARCRIGRQHLCGAGHLPRGILGLGRSSQGRWHRAVRLFATAGVRARRRRSSRRRQRLVASTPPAVHPAVGARSGARQYETGDEPVDLPRVPGQPQPAGTAGLCDTMRPNATMCDHAAGVAQLVERQPSKLNVDGSSPFARFDACAHIRLLLFAFVRKQQAEQGVGCTEGNVGPADLLILPANWGRFP